MPRIRPYVDGNTFVFGVEAKPVGFKRDLAVKKALGHRAGAHGGLRNDKTVKAVMDFRDTVAWEFRCAVRELAERPSWLREDGSYVGLVSLDIEFTGATDDVINVGKEVEDALNRLAWADDCLVKAIRVSHPARRSTGNGGIRRCPPSEEPGLRIAITYLEPHLTNAPAV